MQIEFFFDSQIFLYPPLKLTPLFCVSLCVSVLVSESVKLTLLWGDFAQSKSGHWTNAACSLPSTPPLTSGPRSSFTFTLHFTQLLNKSIKQGGNSSGINEHFNHLIARLPYSKSASFSVKPLEEMWHEWKTEQAERRQQQTACLPIFPVVWSWRWKSHLIINTATGSCTLHRHRPVSII